jgi:predicted lipoprotein with Yx(FWY)xxD motif
MIKFARVNLVLALAGISVAVAACGGSPPARQAASSPTPAASAPSNQRQEAAAPTAPSVGGIMVNDRGMTVYSFDRDQPSRSACTGRCEQNWRPVLARPNPVLSHEWTTVTRRDGGQQWAYLGRPLYTSARDRQAGDMTGDGLDNGQWHVVRRAPAS